MASPNYITPTGAKKLSDELDFLLRRERPKTVDEVAAAAALGDRSENAEYKYGKLRLRDIDRRIRFLQRRLDRAMVIDPAEQASEQVVFGALVEVESEEGKRKSYRIVGEDESDPGGGEISWRSPMGRSLLKRRVGDIVTVRRPAGDVELEIVGLSFASGPAGD